MQERSRQQVDWQHTLGQLARRDLRLTALIAFAVGVMLHACVIYAVLGTSNGGADGVGTNPTPAVVRTTPTASALPDRTDCNLIRNTTYRSEAERRWFLANCVGG